MKTLEQAIGCWTVNPDYNSIPEFVKRLSKQSWRCRYHTRKGDPEKLLEELVLLKRQTDTFNELVQSAVNRCNQIIETKELRP